MHLLEKGQRCPSASSYITSALLVGRDVRCAILAGIPMRDIAHQTFILGSLDGRMAEETSELLWRECTPVLLCHRHQGWRGLEGRERSGTHLTKFLTGTHATVTPIEAVGKTNGRGQFSAMLYSPVIETETSIQSVGCKGRTEFLPALLQRV